MNILASEVDVKRVTDDEIKEDIQELRQRLEKAGEKLGELHPPKTREDHKKTQLLNQEIEHVMKMLALARSALNTPAEPIGGSDQDSWFQ